MLPSLALASQHGYALGYELDFDFDFDEDGMDSPECEGGYEMAIEGGYEMAIDDMSVEDPMHASPVSKPLNGRRLNPTLHHMYQPTLVFTVRCAANPASASGLRFHLPGDIEIHRGCGLRLVNSHTRPHMYSCSHELVFPIAGRTGACTRLISPAFVRRNPRGLACAPAPRHRHRQRHRHQIGSRHIHRHRHGYRHKHRHRH